MHKVLFTRSASFMCLSNSDTCWYLLWVREADFFELEPELESLWFNSINLWLINWPLGSESTQLHDNYINVPNSDSDSDSEDSELDVADSYDSTLLFL